MKVNLKRANNAFHFEAKGSNGTIINMDASPAIGGEDKGPSPMEVLLMSLAGCASVDAIMILEKQRQKLEDYSVDVEGEREGEQVKPYKKINMHFTLKGDLDEKKVNKALDLSVNKYCSVSESLDKNIKITYSFDIVK